MSIGIGCKVTLHYAIRLADGMEVDSSFGGEPLTLVTGDGTLDPGLEMALYGLYAGQRQTLTLRPGQAFGIRDPEAIQWMPRQAFPAGIVPEPGQIIAFDDGQGGELPGAILEVEAERVKVDFNHPLAGREIEFEVEILAVDYGDTGEEA